MKLWQKGLVVFTLDPRDPVRLRREPDVPVRSVLGGLLNTVFMSAGVGGLLREFSRLSVFVGLAILIIGLIRRK